MTQGTTPPGWYDDGTGGLRWWDGARWTDHVQLPSPPSGSAPGGRRTLLLAVLGVVAALVVAGVIIAVVVLGGDDDSTDEASDTPSGSTSEATSEAASPSPSETPAPSPSTATPPPAPEPEPSATATAEPDPADIGRTTCGEVRAMSTDELVDLLDEAARQEVAGGGDEDAQTYLDLPRAQRRAFAEFLPTTCEGQPDGTALDDIDDF